VTCYIIIQPPVAVVTIILIRCRNLGKCACVRVFEERMVGQDLGFSYIIGEMLLTLTCRPGQPRARAAPPRSVANPGSTQLRSRSFLPALFPDHALLPQQPVVGHGKPVRLVSNLLDVVQRNPFGIQPEGEHFVRHIDLLFPFRDGDDRDIHADCGERPTGSGELPFPAIDDHQIRERGMLVHQPAVPALDDLGDGGSDSPGGSVSCRGCGGLTLTRGSGM